MKAGLNWAILVGVWKTVVPRAMGTMETQLKRFQRGPRVAVGLEAILNAARTKLAATFRSLPKHLPGAKL